MLGIDIFKLTAHYGQSKVNITLIFVKVLEAIPGIISEQFFNPNNSTDFS